MTALNQIPHTGDQATEPPRNCDDNNGVIREDGGRNVA